MLSLSSGIDASVQAVEFISLASAIGAPILDQKQFDYGAQPFIVFSKVIDEATGQDAQSYLDEQVLTPLGISVPLARTYDNAQIPILSAGGRATLSDLAVLGLELLDAAKGQGRVFTASDVDALTTPGLNPTYGIGFWLNDDGISVDGTTVAPRYPSCDATAVFHALGAGGQILTVVPEHDLVVAKSAAFGAVAFQEAQTFWDLLFDGLDCQCNV